jgi:hypothetical protein
MSALTCIAPDLTVRQVALGCPACARVLEQCPEARWDGLWSLQELGALARDCAIDEHQLMRDLADVAHVPVESSGKTARESSPMPLVFVAILVGVSLGAAWGVGLLLRIALGADYGVVPAASVHVHGVAQLWGWMALFVFAVAAHVLRQNTKRRPPAWLDHLGSASVVAALVAFVVGTRGLSDVVASALLSLGAACFAVSAMWSLVGRGQRPMLWHGFVIAMIVWLGLWCATDLYLRVRYANEPLLPISARSLLIAIPVLGFATNAIYGFGIRLIPGLLNVTSLRPRCFAATLVLHNLGLPLLLFVPLRVAHTAGAALMLLAAAVYLVGMNGLRGAPSRPIYGIDPRGHVLIRAAFFWLVVGLAMILVEQLAPRELPHAYSGAWRHALTVGFITTMMLGVGHRLLPVFIRRPLASTRLMLVSAMLILVGNAGRVILELATIGGWRWAFRLMGVTGVLELAALILFAINLALTVRNRRRVWSDTMPLTADTRLRELVNARPAVQQRLRELGITMFDAAPFIAPSMTLGALARASRMRPDELVEALREGSKPSPITQEEWIRA